MPHAAGQWIKYNNDINLAPPHGMWCLWSIIISGYRNYFAGSSFEHNGTPHIFFTPFRTIEIDNTCYYAHVHIIDKASLPRSNDVIVQTQSGVQHKQREKHHVKDKK